MLSSAQFHSTRKAFLLFLLSVPFILAGTAKLFNPLDFGVSLRYTFNLPISLSLIIALILPALEILTGLSVVLLSLRQMGVILARFLTIAFMLAHSWILFFSNSTSGCGCFGNILELNYQSTSLLSLALLIAAWSPFRFYEATNSANNKTRKKQTRKPLVLFSISILLFLAASAVRFQRLEKGLHIGLLSMGTTAYALLESRMSTHLQKAQTMQKFSFFLFLKKPDCQSCIAELQFWAGYNGQKDFRVFVVFSETASEKVRSLITALNIDSEAVQMDDRAFAEMVGTYSPLIGRLLLSSNGKVLLSGHGEGTEENRNKYLALIQSKLKLNNQ